jgi:hypothetical protein
VTIAVSRPNVVTIAISRPNVVTIAVSRPNVVTIAVSRPDVPPTFYRSVANGLLAEIPVDPRDNLATSPILYTCICSRTTRR